MNLELPSPLAPFGLYGFKYEKMDRPGVYPFIPEHYEAGIEGEYCQRAFLGLRGKEIMFLDDKKGLDVRVGLCFQVQSDPIGVIVRGLIRRDLRGTGIPIVGGGTAPKGQGLWGTKVNKIWWALWEQGFENYREEV